MTQQLELWEMALSKVISLNINFIDISGSVNAGIVLSNLWFWKDKGSDPDGWIYKTQGEWYEETRLTVNEMTTARQLLRKKELIEEKRSGIPAKLYYRVNREKVKESLESLVAKGVIQIAEKRNSESVKTTRSDRGKVRNKITEKQGSRSGKNGDLSYITTNTTTKTNNITRSRNSSDKPDLDLSFSSNPEQANPETNEPDPSPTISSLEVQKPNLETERQIQTDSETQGKVIADVEEKETPLPPFAVAFPSETSEENKTECGNDPRFDKKIPFSGDITDSSYRNELKYFVPKLSGEFFEIGGIKRSFERQNAVNAKTLLCMLNEKGIDAIANLEKFIDFYYTKTLARTEHYKNHSFDKETLKVAVLKAITKKIANDDTEILIQLVSTFSKDAKAIANPQKPISEPLPEKKGIPFNPAFAEKLKSKQNQHRRKSSDISPLNLVNDVSSTLDHKTA